MPKVKFKDKIVNLKKGEKLPDHEDEIAIPYACYVGACQTCACQVVSGEENIKPINENEEMMGAEGNNRLACQIEFNDDVSDEATLEIVDGW